MAKKFTFRLESVLKLREHDAKNEKSALLQIVNSRYGKENEIEERIEYFEDMLKVNINSQTVADYQAHYHHRQQIKAEIARLNLEREQLLEIEDIQREKLNKAKQEEKAISKLKDRKKQQYIEETEREERNILDEIAQNRHGKSNILEQ